MDKNIEFLLNMKLFELKREGMDYLNLNNLKDVIYNTKWLINVPSQLHKIAKDINSLTGKEVADYLSSRKVVTDFDFDDLEVNLDEEW